MYLNTINLEKFKNIVVLKEFIYIIGSKIKILVNFKNKVIR